MYKRIRAESPTQNLDIHDRDIAIPKKYSPLFIFKVHPGLIGLIDRAYFGG